MSVTKLSGTVGGPAGFADITILIWGSALRTCALNVPVRQKTTTPFTIELLNFPRYYVVVFFCLKVNYFRMSLVFGSVGRIEFIETNFESRKISPMSLMKFLYQSLGGHSLLGRVDLNRSPVSVRCAYVKDIFTNQS